MKTILIFVTSLDGKVTKWGDSHIRFWSSKNDQDHFDAIWKETRVIIMGSKTFEPDPVKPGNDHLFVVMTRAPGKYKKSEVRGQLEFTDKSPADLIERFEKEGEEKVLIVGGPHIATLFFKEELINELWLTFEPRIFGTGENFVIGEKLDINLNLLSSEIVNKRGTLINKYIVMRSPKL